MHDFHLQVIHNVNLLKKNNVNSMQCAFTVQFLQFGGSMCRVSHCIEIDASGIVPAERAARNEDSAVIVFGELCEFDDVSFFQLHDIFS